MHSNLLSPYPTDDSSNILFVICIDKNWNDASSGWTLKSFNSTTKFNLLPLLDHTVKIVIRQSLASFVCKMHDQVSDRLVWTKDIFLKSAADRCFGSSKMLSLTCREEQAKSLKFRSAV